MPMTMTQVPARPAGGPRPGPVVYAIGSGGVILRFAQPPGHPPIANLNESAFTTNWYYASGAAAPSVVGTQPQRRRAWLRSCPHPGDPISVHFDGGAAADGDGAEHGASGAFGSVVETATGFAQLVCHHVAEPRPGRVSYIYTPADRWGGLADTDRVGQAVEVPPAGDANGPTLDLGLVALGGSFRGQPVSREQLQKTATRVRPVLWAATARTDAREHPPHYVVAPPPGADLATWVRQQLPPDWKLADVQDMIPFSTRLNVGRAFQGELEMRARVRDGWATVTITGLFGTVVGDVALGQDNVGDTVCTAAGYWVTEGELVAVDAAGGPVAYGSDGSQSADFRGWCVVKGKCAGQPFSVPGHSGAPVYVRRKDNPAELDVCGMVVAGMKVDDSVYTLVQPIRPCLDRCKAKLLTHR